MSTVFLLVFSLSDQFWRMGDFFFVILQQMMRLALCFFSDQIFQKVASLVGWGGGGREGVWQNAWQSHSRHRDINHTINIVIKHNKHAIDTRFTRDRHYSRVTQPSPSLSFFFHWLACDFLLSLREADLLRLSSLASLASFCLWARIWKK